MSALSKKEFFKEYVKILRNEIIVTVILIFLYFFFLSNFMGYGYDPRFAANSDAKLLFANTAEYIEKSAEKSNILADGVYYGVIRNKNENGSYDIRYEDILYSGTSDDLRTALSWLMGVTEPNCYYVMIKNGSPAYAYWSRDVSMLEYVNTFTNMIERGEPPEKCGNPYNDYFALVPAYRPLVFGGYPSEIRESAEKPTKKINSEPQTPVFKNEHADNILKNHKKSIILTYITAYSAIILALAVLAAVLAFLHFRISGKKISGDPERIGAE